METNRIQPSFGMIKYYRNQESAVRSYINRFPYKITSVIKAEEHRQLNNPTDIFLSLVNTVFGTRMQARVGLKTYTEGTIRRNPIKTIIRAGKEADRLTDYQAAKRELTQGMNIPQLR